MSNRIFYDLFYSEDDGGWYGEVFEQDMKDLFTTDIMKQKSDVTKAIKAKYPNAELLKEFS